MVSTWPRGPNGAITLPFQRTSMPPALPTFMVARSRPVSVFDSLGCKMPEKISLPSLLIDS